MLPYSSDLHEKAQDSRHNESTGFLIAIIGSIFMMGGMLQSLVTVQRPERFLVSPFQLGSSPYDFLGLAFTVVGVMLLLGGIILAVYYASQRSWYCNALKESYRFEEEELKAVKRLKKNKRENPDISLADSEAVRAFRNRS